MTAAGSGAASAAAPGAGSATGADAAAGRDAAGTVGVANPEAQTGSSRSTGHNGPGRPPSGARERILAAALEVLKKDGYAGLTMGKVAETSSESKALIAYHFGSKAGLVAAAAREVGATIIAEVLDGLGEPGSCEELVRGLVAGVWRVIDRDEGLQRVYFDLTSQSVVEESVREIMSEMKREYRAVLRELMHQLDDGPKGDARDAAAVYLIAGVEGLAMERLEHGDTPVLRRARELFESSAAAALRG